MRYLVPGNRLARLMLCFAVIASIIAATLAGGVTAHAAGGLAISGGFPEQLVIPQGGSASGPSINIVVFNNRDTDITFSMKTDAPPGVNIILSQEEFTLSPGTNKEILVRIEVESYADPGTHQISITAEAYSEGVSGIQLVGAPGRSASLTILGESAHVTLNAVSPEGTPVVAVVRLYRVVDNWNYEIGYSNTGSLQATVAPGSFVAEAYVGGQKLDEQSFEIATGESKVINLTAGTIYFEQFDVLEYYSDTGAFAFAQVVYTVRNVYEPVADASIVLTVTRNGQSLGEVQIASLSTLDTGRFSLNYNYFPFDGWSAGNYGFKLQLLFAGKPYTHTLEKYIDVTGGGTAPVAGNGSNVPLIAGIVCGVALLLGIAYFMIHRSRKNAGAAKPGPGGSGKPQSSVTMKQRLRWTGKQKKGRK